MKVNMNILLTTSAAPTQSPFSTSEKRPPIGIGFLISVLRNAGHEVFFIDNYLQPSNFLETDYLQRNKIGFVGIYANTICYRDTLRMFYRLEFLRRSGRWNGKIIVGGPHATVALDTIPGFVDHVVQGEGEQAILDIVEGRVNDRVVCLPPVKNLDDLPMPAWDYFINLPYKWSVDWFSVTPIFTMNTSRGCPFRCSFCSVGSIWGKQYTYFSAERIVSEIEYLIKQYNAKGIYFREDNFTLNKSRLRRFCELLIEKDLRIPWFCESRVNTLDRETVELMHRAGVRAFYFGVESGSQRILDFLQKDISIEQTRTAFRLCHEFGIKTAASIIVGVPTETEDDREATRRLIREIKPTVTWYNVFVGIPNSRLYRYSIDNKLYEFVDDRGLVYLKGHNDLVKQFYGGQWNADIPYDIHNPEISVVMSVYNGEKYVEAAIKSILNQTYQNFEFIIVDDASTDNTAQLLKSFSDPRIRLIPNNVNQGLTASLIEGASAARGKYLARMDADDISLPHRFEVQLEFLKKNPACALVGSSYYHINEAGDITKVIKVPTDYTSLKEGLAQQNWFGHGTVMIRKQAYDEVHGYDPQFIYAQDYDLWIRLAERYQVTNIDDPLYSWRSTQTCISRDKATEQSQYAAMARRHSRERKQEHEKANAPLVSVIVPTFNRPQTLEETIKSILSQTYSNVEIIVINDAGSNIEDLISSLNSRGTITYIRHDRNRGLAAARNTGIKASRGKYIAYLDDDDVYYPDHVSTLVDSLKSNNAKVAYTDAYRAHQVEANGKYVTTLKDVPYSFDFDPDRILQTNFIPVLCFMHERLILNETGLFDENLKRLEDWDMWIRMSRKYHFIHIKKTTCEFSWRTDGSTMTSASAAEFVNARRQIAEKYGIPQQNEKLIVKPRQKAIKDLVSIVILTINQLQYTKECIESIRNHTPECHEIIFVDNGSTDGTVAWLRQLLNENANYKLIVNKTNLGFAKGCNQGIQASSGEYLLLLNNDVVVTDGWLAGLLECCKYAPDAGIVGPMTNNISGIQRVGDASYDRQNLDEYATAFRNNYRHRRIPQRRIVGFCMLFKRALAEIAGLLDDSFGTGNFEDDDYCLRVELEGYRNYIAGDVFIHHYGSRSFIGNNMDHSAAMGGNRKLFNQKWAEIDYGAARGRNALSLQLIEKAVELFEEEKNKEAVDTLLAGIKRMPGQVRLYYELIEKMIEMKQFEEAKKLAGEMPQEADESRMQVILGYCEEGLEQLNAADTHVLQSLAIKPELASAINLQGVLSFKKGDTAAAENYFRKAIDCDPGYGEPYTNLGVLLWGGDRKADGLEYLEKGCMLSPTVQDMSLLYHSAISSVGEYGRAEEVFHEALRRYPHNKRIRLFLIDMLLKQGKSAESIPFIEDTLAASDIDDDLLNAAIAVRKTLSRKGLSEGKKHSISLCMIVKNEEKYLAQCLRSVKPLVDEIVIVDTGSSDRTKKIAEAFGAELYDYAWTEDFSKARNVSLEHAHGEWIVILDGDEVISERDHDEIRRLVGAKHKKSFAYSFKTRNYIPDMRAGWVANDGSYREEAGSGWIPSDKVRLFKRSDKIRFVNPVHELVEPSLHQAGHKLIECAVPIHHYGKLDSERSTERQVMYFELGMSKLQKNENNPKAIFELAIQANELGRYEEAVSLWQRLIALKPDFAKAYLNITKSFGELGRIDEARQASERALSLNPGDRDALFNLALTEFYAGDLTRTEQVLSDILQKERDYPMAMGLASLTAFIGGRGQDAMLLRDKLRRSGFRYSEYIAAQARKLAQLGQQHAACTLLKEAYAAGERSAVISEVLKELNKVSPEG